MRRIAITAAVLLLAGCSGTSGGSDAGVDAGRIDIEDPVIRVSGTAQIHPSALAWLQEQAQAPPALEGLTLRVQEPLRVALNDPLAIFGSITLGADPTFSIDGVDTALVNTGVAVGILDERTDGPKVVVRTSTAVWDVRLEEGKPDTDIASARAFALPTAYHDALSAAVGADIILATTTQQFDALTDSGFLLGRVVDAAGLPLAGVAISASSDYRDRIHYPSADYASANQTATSATGLFVYIHPGTSGPSQFTFQVADRPEYRQRNGGAALGAGLLMTVYPGTTAP